MTHNVTKDGATQEPWYADVVLPALLRGARGSYGKAIAHELAAAGFDDMPRNGSFVIGGIARNGSQLGDLGPELGVTKQAASQLIDTLVTRGYLERRADTVDRRKMLVDLTDRGRAAADAVRSAVRATDAELATRLSAEHLEGLRAGLAALADIAGERPATQQESPASVVRLAPIFPVSDLRAALAHYAALGFTVTPYRGGDEYGFARRDRVHLHLQAHHHDPAEEHDHEHGASAAYLNVTDADALYAEWSKPGIGGETQAPFDAEWGMREGSHVDPDGNLIRFGTELRRRADS
jgi:DNA-binding MarR family transcriptional regulator/uncharacterized glyoxalase superfamily protein PhnB